MEAFRRSLPTLVCHDRTAVTTTAEDSFNRQPADSGDTNLQGSVERLYAQLRQRILWGEMLPGSAISQAHLSRELNVGRPALREAFRMLQREGLVEAEYNRRLRVARLSLAQFEQLYAQRLLTESLAVRLTAGRLTAGEIAEAHRLQQELEDRWVSLSFEEFEDKHRQFHLILASHAGEDLFASVQQLAEHTRRYRLVLRRESRDVPSLGVGFSSGRGPQEHRELLEACEAGNAELAGRRVAAHLGRTAISFIAMSDPRRDPFPVREALRMVVGEE